MPNKNELETVDLLQEVEKDNGVVYWRKWYIAVVLFLVAQIIFYYLITQHFK